MSTLNTTNLKNPSSGSNNIVLNTDGTTTVPTLSSTTITGTTIQGTIKQGTSVASTSGTSIDFTGIPSWVKRITVMFDGVSINGTSVILIQIGDSGGIENTGYVAYSGVIQDTVVNSANYTTGYGMGNDNAAANVHSGLHTLANLSGNIWTLSGSARQAGNRILMAAGSKTLSATLDRVRITTVNGTDAFDAGTINIAYEG